MKQKSSKHLLSFILCFFSFPLLFATNNSVDSLSVLSKDTKKVIALGKSSLVDNFSIELDGEANINDPEIESLIGQVEGAFQFVKQNNKYVNKLQPDQLNELPVGMKKELSNVTYSMVVTKARFMPEFAEIEVFAKIEIPQKDAKGQPKSFYLGSSNIKLSYGGKIIGNAKLGLLGDVYIPFNGRKWMLTLEGGRLQSTGQGVEQHTHALIDCDGVKELALDANLQVSRNVVVPLDSNGDLLPEYDVVNNRTVRNRVRADFSLKLANWNDLLIEVNLPSFAISRQVCNKERGYFSFTLNKAVLDLSDTRNSDQVVFPEIYKKGGYLVAGAESWRGLYIKNIEVGMPEEFKVVNKKSGKIKFGAQNFIIDSYGVSGMFSAKNLITIDQGVTNDKNGMGYSVDKIGVEIAASKLVGGELEGKLQLPVSNKTKRLDFSYTGKITDDEYLLRVTTAREVELDIWSARATLHPSSYVEMRVAKKEFLPKAVLNGTLSIDGGKSSTSLKELEFEELTIQTKGPLLSVKAFGLNGEHQIGNFPVSLNDVQIEMNNGRANLGFGIRVGLQENSFSASGRIKIKGEVGSNGEKQLWKYRGIDISEIELNNVDVGVAVVSGRLALMKDDPIYGDGFEASLDAKIKGLSVDVGMNAIFGKKATYRYWGFQGFVDGLPLGTGVINVTGFTGSAFYHMTPRGFSKNGLLKLQPDKSVGLGLRAGVFGSIASKGTASFMAAFNIRTNSGGGIAEIGFEGEALIMKNLSDAIGNPMEAIQDNFQKYMSKAEVLASLNGNSNQKDSYTTDDKQSIKQSNYPADQSRFKNVPIYAKLGMSYNFNTSTFHANLDVKINVAGGLIKGVGHNNTAGWAVLHISPKDWYLYIGTSENMIGLSVGVGSIRVEARSYFMVGTKIPGSPPPPVEVAEILGTSTDDLNYMKDLNNLGKGRGFAFGSHFKFDTGDMTMLFLYARFAAGVGADIMLKNYGAEAKCVNRGNQQIGINGWYANGQAYVYLKGELGIKVNLFFIKKRIPIIEAGVAALLQVRAPNPFWMRGYLGGYYNLLGGLVSGRFRFKMEFGDKCELANESVLGGVKIITDVSPRKNSKDVDVFAIPQATFAMKTNTPIVIPEDDGDHTYKILIDKFTITDAKGRVIEGEMKAVDGSSDVMDFVSKDILPPNQQLKATVQVSFLEKKNGVYKVLTQNGKKAIEVEERIFTTGGAPTYIPLRNIKYSYPVVKQDHYYEGESNTGYIQLKRGQDYLFEGSKWKTRVAIKDENDRQTKTNFSYNSGSNTVSFRMTDVQQQQKYTLQIVGVSTSSSGNTTRHKNTANPMVSGTINKKNADFRNNETKAEATIAKKKASSGLKSGEIERLSYTFRTSKYYTLQQKMNAFKTEHLWLKVSTAVVSLYNNMNTDEYFDATELKGSQYTNYKPLIEIEALLDDSYANFFHKLIYNDYANLGAQISNHAKRIKTVGIPPRKGIHVSTQYLTFLKDEKKSNSYLRSLFPYRYDVFTYYYMDWYDIYTKFSNGFVDGRAGSAKATDILESKYPVIKENIDYNARVRYILPGNKRGRTVQRIKYQF